MEMFLRNFKWYRKMKGGKWWKVRDYNSFDYEEIWMHNADNIIFPEFDGLFMDDIGSFYLKRGVGFSFEGWVGMQETSTENYGENK